jgi:hypothetical protein
MKAAIRYIILPCIFSASAAAFAPARCSIRRYEQEVTPRRRHVFQSTSSAVKETSNNPQAGIDPFEEWFASNSSNGARVSNIRHTMFQSGSLRGLEFTSKSSQDLNRVAVVPRKLVLSVPYSEDDENEWDTKLSCRLVEECRKGKDSLYYGYCALLTNGANLDPNCKSYPSTAPDALRHWTDDQKALLEQSEKGKKLLKAEQQQRDKWNKKYDALTSAEKQDMSLNDFLWAMEAVHSRAFRGDFGALDGGEGGQLRKLASLLLPLSALAFGIVYASDPGMNQYYVPLAVVAAAPVLLTMIANKKGSKEAVMLPLIDSANHLQEADSVIEFDPSVDGFVLSLGRKCLVKEVGETGEKAQVCISYGLRGDSELLVNYGFLRGVNMDKVAVDDGERNVIRKQLAETYLSRNT